MLFRTLSDARTHHNGCSWIHVQVVQVRVKGREYFRTYEFDQTVHKCKRCRNALRRNHRKHHRLASTGHICEICGNPYAFSVRERAGYWFDAGRLH